jgi:hypothetical protein
MTRRGAKVDPATQEALAAQGLGGATGPGGNGNGNGHGEGLFGDDGFFEGKIKDSEQPSMVREFLHPGKDALELLNRTRFDDLQQAQLMTLFLSWCDEFSDTDGETDAKRLMSAINSIGGYARDQALQGWTETYRGSDFPKKKKSGGGFHLWGGDGDSRGQG